MRNKVGGAWDEGPLVEAGIRVPRPEPPTRTHEEADPLKVCVGKALVPQEELLLGWREILVTFIQDVELRSQGQWIIAKRVVEVGLERGVAGRGI